MKIKCTQSMYVQVFILLALPQPKITPMNEEKNVRNTACMFTSIHFV